MDADKHGGVEKCGYVQKLSESGFPYITQWKKRYIVLSKGKLFIYEKSDSKGSQKNSEAIDLKYFNHIVEADEKDAKKVPNVFLITSNERTFFDSGRITLAADSKEEMQHWIESLMKSLEFIKNNSNPNKVYVFQGSLGKTTNPSNEPVITKFEEVRPVTTDARDSLNFSPFSNKEFHSQPDNKPENGLPGGIETKPLNNITRSRAKGPAGRRAPRNRHTMQARPSSLILLNPKEEHEDNQRSASVHGSRSRLSALTTSQISLGKPSSNVLSISRISIIDEYKFDDIESDLFFNKPISVENENIKPMTVNSENIKPTNIDIKRKGSFLRSSFSRIRKSFRRSKYTRPVSQNSPITNSTIESRPRSKYGNCTLL